MQKCFRPGYGKVFLIPRNSYRCAREHTSYRYSGGSQGMLDPLSGVQVLILLFGLLRDEYNDLFI